MNSSVVYDPTIYGRFTEIDYAVFIFMLSISTAIGIYFGCCGKSSQSTEEYLLGGRQMKTIPIAISLVASQLSGITIMAIPAEMYAFGSGYWIIIVSTFFAVLVITVVFVPVFYKNHISNCYEYLEMRFGRVLRRLITFSFVMNIYLVLPVVVFVPSLAFSQVSGVNVHIINCCVCSVCVFYTMLGGIKAVVWTDVIQGAIMLGSCILTVVFGVYKVGGLANVYKFAEEGGRIDFDTTLDLTTRQTVWNAGLGYFVVLTVHTGFSQSCVQRIVSVPTLNHAKRALLLFVIGWIAIMSLNCFTGIVMYARYHDCDPITAGIVEKPDKMVPYFVQDVVGHWNGMTGLFISCVFSAAMSTMSAYMNSLAGIVYEDYVRPLKLFPHSERSANLAMKTLVCLSGAYCVTAGIIVEKLPHILQIVMTISGLSVGAVMGAFCMGMLWPFANRIGVLSGVICSIVGMAWLSVGQQIIIKQNLLRYPHLPQSIDGCSEMGINATIINDSFQRESTLSTDEFSIYKIAFPWFGLIGALIVIVIAVPVSYLTGGQDLSVLDPSLISPVAHWMLPSALRKPLDKRWNDAEEKTCVEENIKLNQKII